MTNGTPAFSAGFTLLEVLIAFTITTTSLGLLFRVQANSTATVVLSEEYQNATALAQSLIAELAVTERSLAFTRSGTTGKFEWSVRSNAYSGLASAGDEPAPYLLRSMVIEVAWPGRDRDRRIALNTIKPLFEVER